MLASMVDLDPQDRARLVGLLAKLDELSTESGRRAVLRDSGLVDFAPRIDTSGSPQQAIGRMVQYLASFGRRPQQPDAEVLGVLINWVKTMVGVEDQTALTELLTRYKMMVPLASLPRLGGWNGKRDAAAIYEKIIGENTLRPIAFLARGIEVAKAVAYIGLPDQSGSGSGFLVGKSLLMTNFHVLGDRACAEKSIYRFNYQNDWSGAAMPVTEYRARAGGVWFQSEELDVTLVELDGEPGATWGWVPLKPGAVAIDTPVSIIQHPGGQAKQISMQNNLVEYVDDKIVQYVTSTLPGSSGAPAFNERWEIVALHHAGGASLAGPSGSRHYANEGIRMSAIVAALPAGTI